MAESLGILDRWGPGDRVAHVLSQVPEADRKPLLAYREQQAKRRADLEALREIRAYKARRDF